MGNTHTSTGARNLSFQPFFHAAGKRRRLPRVRGRARARRGPRADLGTRQFSGLFFAQRIGAGGGQSLDHLFVDVVHVSTPLVSRYRAATAPTAMHSYFGRFHGAQRSAIEFCDRTPVVEPSGKLAARVAEVAVADLDFIAAM